MARKTIRNNAEMAAMIRGRRTELGLTIEEAARRANVGTKTWCRYEAGEPIRADKYAGVCKALGWRTIPALDEEDGWNINAYRTHEAWSAAIAKDFGDAAAASFAIGTDILLDHLRMEREELACMPRGSHIGQLNASWLESDLPAQFLTRYDYEFLYALECTVEQLIRVAVAGNRLIAHSVLEELALYMIVENARGLMEDMDLPEEEEDWDEWIYDVFDDDDIVMCLYSRGYLDETHIYHFDHWMKRQFYSEEA